MEYFVIGLSSRIFGIPISFMLRKPISTLPKSNELPVNFLAACFNNTSATYKFYWFLAILEMAEKGKLNPTKRELFASMISNAWFTVNYFHVSFGKQDLIQEAVHAIKLLEGISIDEKQEIISKKLIASEQIETYKKLHHFDKQVPHWFLSPWFPKLINETDGQRRNRIYIQSQSFQNNCLYALFDDHIEINSDWWDYLHFNTAVLKEFCYWNLALFLQAKNPNVPDIPNKVIKPALRNSLQLQRTKYWDIVFQELGDMDCIYTNTKLNSKNYAVEHFIPYNFVAHDLIWNLIPASKSFNSTKSDKIPSLEKYFDAFYQLQCQAIEIIQHKEPKNKFLQDYLTIFPDADNYAFALLENKSKFKEQFQPLVTIALNNGFEMLTV